MRWALRLTPELLGQVHADLDRPHPVAFERVGYFVCRLARGKEDASLLVTDYFPMNDDWYLPSSEVGALVGADGIRAAMQLAYRSQCALVHVHRHEHAGAAGFSTIDEAENAKLIPTFWNVAPKMPHGAVVLSFDRAHGRVWDCVGRTIHLFDSIRVVGRRVRELS